MRRARWAVVVYMLATVVGLALVLERPVHSPGTVPVTAPIGAMGHPDRRPTVTKAHRPPEPWAAVPLRLPTRAWLKAAANGASRVLGGFAARPRAAVAAAYPGLRRRPAALQAPHRGGRSGVHT